MVSRRDITTALTKLVKAGIADLDAGRGETDPSVTDCYGRPLEWVVIGTGLWDRHCQGITAPWNCRGITDEEAEAVWDILETVAAKLGHTRGIALNTGDGCATDVSLERPVPRGARQGCTCRSQSTRR